MRQLPEDTTDDGRKAATFGSAQANLEAQGKEPAGRSIILLPVKYSSKGAKSSQEEFALGELLEE